MKKICMAICSIASIIIIKEYADEVVSQHKFKKWKEKRKNLYFEDI